MKRIQREKKVQVSIGGTIYKGDGEVHLVKGRIYIDGYEEAQAPNVSGLPVKIIAGTYVKGSAGFLVKA